MSRVWKNRALRRHDLLSLACAKLQTEWITRFRTMWTCPTLTTLHANVILLRYSMGAHAVDQPLRFQHPGSNIVYYSAQSVYHPLMMPGLSL